MSRQLSTTRPFRGYGLTTHPPVSVLSGAGRPLAAGLPSCAIPAATQKGAGGWVFAGMDPTDMSTYVRPWNPQPGMIAYLNFDGAAVAGDSDTGGVGRRDVRYRTLAGGRPKRRPRLCISSRRFPRMAHALRGSAYGGSRDL
jgi:hypothetical protein